MNNNFIDLNAYPHLQRLGPMLEMNQAIHSTARELEVTEKKMALLQQHINSLEQNPAINNPVVRKLHAEAEKKVVSLRAQLQIQQALLEQEVSALMRKKDAALSSLGTNN